MNDRIKELKERIVRSHFLYVQNYIGDEKREDPNEDLWEYLKNRKNLQEVLYGSFSRDELTKLMKITAKMLKYSPPQSQVHPVMREILKRRFGKWPYVLSEAGLSPSAGRGGISYEKAKERERERQELLGELREKALEMGHIPHTHQVPHLSSALKKYYKVWGDALKDAGVDPFTLGDKSISKVENLEPEYEKMLMDVKQMAVILGRAPTHIEVEYKMKKALLKRFGSWRNVLFQIDLKAVIRDKPFSKIYLDYRRKVCRKGHSARLNNCFFKLVSPSEEIVEALGRVSAYYAEHGVYPRKEQVSEDDRKILISACLSWNNVLYQINKDNEI